MVKVGNAMNLSLDPLNFVHYLFDFTDSVGIFQHSHHGIPNRYFGYTTDDNARALILAVMLYNKFKDKKYLSLINTYLSFIHHAQNEKGKFKNFMNYQREFIEEEGSEDCFGRCIWALSYTATTKSIPKNVRRACFSMLREAERNINSIQSPRAKAYIIIGLSFLKPSKALIEHIKNLTLSLAEIYNTCKDKSWHWFENNMTYSNAIMPRALLVGSQILKNSIYMEIAKESMNFLESITFEENYFKPIGCNGWYIKGQSPAKYDEQPIEACETLFTYMDFYAISQSEEHLNKALACFNWYLGKNSQKLSLVDQETGACFDGLTPNGLNLNQGSESIVSYGMAYMKIYTFL